MPSLPEGQEDLAGHNETPYLIGEFGQGVLKGFSGMAKGMAGVLKSIDDVIDPQLGVAPRDADRMENYSMFKLGQSIDRMAEDLFPLNPQARQDFIAKLAGGAGSIVPFVLGGVAGKAFKFGEYVVPASMGALQNAASQYEDAINSGADEDTAMNVFWQGFAIGSLEGLPIGTWAKKLNTASGNALNKTIARNISLGKTTPTAVSEGFQEFTTQVLNNASAISSYDETRKLFEGALESGMIGSILGKTLDAAAKALEQKKSDPNNTPSDLVAIKKAQEFVAEKQEKMKDVGDNDFVKLDDDSQAVQSLKKQKAELEIDLADRTTPEEIKTEIAAKVEEINAQIEEVKVAEREVAVNQVAKEGELADMQETLNAMEAQKAQSTPATQELLQPKIDELFAGIEALKEEVKPLTPITNGKEETNNQSGKEVLTALQEDKGVADNVTPIVEPTEIVKLAEDENWSALDNFIVNNAQSVKKAEMYAEPMAKVLKVIEEDLDAQGYEIGKDYDEGVIKDKATGELIDIEDLPEPLRKKVEFYGNAIDKFEKYKSDFMDDVRKAETIKPTEINEKPTTTTAPKGRKSGNNAKSIQQNVEESADTRPIKKLTNQGRTKRNNRKPGKVGKAALSLETNSPRDAVMKWFIGGGRIRRSALEDIFGKRAKGEFSSRINLMDKESKFDTVNGIADEIWNNNLDDERFTSQDYRDALIEVLFDHKHPNGMATEMVSKAKMDNEVTEDNIKQREYEQKLLEDADTVTEETDNADVDNAIGILETMTDEEIQAYAEGKDAVLDKEIEQRADDWLKDEPMDDDGTTPWDDMTPAEQSKVEKVLDAIDKLKFDNKNNLNAFGIIPEAWNLALDGLKLAIKGGVELSKAIDEFIANLKELSKDKKNLVDGQKFDEKDARAAIEKALKIEPKVEEKTEPKVEPKPEEGKKKRKFTQQVIKDNPAIEESLSDGIIHYDQLPNSVTLAEANGIIEYLGTEEALKAVKDLNNGMSWPVRNTIGQILIKKLQVEGDYDTAIDLLEDVTTRATELGQGIQAFAMFHALTPEGQLRMAQREVSKQRDTKAKKERKKTDKLDKGLRDINKETVKEVVDKVVHKIEKVDAIKPTDSVQPKEYGTKNKVVTKKRYDELKKALKGKFFSNIPPELIEIAAYHVEASGRKFGEFAKAMIKDFGDKVKPYLKSLYESAQSKLKDQYDDFSTQAEIEEGYDKVVSKSVKEAMKDGKVDVAEIITKHYTQYDSAKRTLAEKLVEDAGLTGKEAKDLADSVEREFDRIASEKKKKLFEKIFSKRERATPKIKSLEDDIIKMTNLGAFNNPELIDKYAEKMGWPKLTPENIKEITRLAEIVQTTPEGFKRYAATEDLLKYQAKIKGLSKLEVPLSIWYANMLSGYKTQVINFASNLMNSIGEYTVAVAQNPKQGKILAQAYARGIERGLIEGKSTFKTGYSPIRGKVEVPATLERVMFKGGKLNPANYLKYVRRAMVAVDVVMFEGLKEMRAYQWALKLAADNNSTLPTKAQKQIAMDYVGQNDTTIEDAKNQAELEYQNEVEQINAEPISQKEKNAKLKEAEFNKKRRVFELVEETRDSELFEESRSFGARGTYNYPPEGLLGWAAETLNNASNKFPPMKLVVPFTNIIANVFNSTLHWTPLGFARAYGEGGTITGKLINESFQRKDWDSMSPERQEQAKADLMTRAIIGTTLMTALYLLTKKWDDDDEPLIEVTANGTGDYRKNYELQETGWQPYSIKIGDTWYSYQYSPAMVGFSLIGNLNDYDKYRKEKITDEGMLTKLGAAATLTSRAALDMTFLSSLNGFLSTVAGSNKEDITEDAVRASLNIGKSLVIPNLYTQSAKDVQRIFDIPTKEVGTTLMGNFLRDIPVARNQYFDKVNVFGDPIIPDTDKLWSVDKDSPLFQLIADKKAWVGAPSIRKTTIYDDKLGKERLLTLEEFYNFSILRGQIIKKYVQDHYEKLSKMKDEEVQKAITKVKTSATKKAKAQLQ